MFDERIKKIFGISTKYIHNEENTRLYTFIFIEYEIQSFIARGENKRRNEKNGKNI
jgi:hypothetical protein